MKKIAKNTSNWIDGICFNCVNYNVLQPAYAKGLKVFLNVNTNLAGQSVTIDTNQFGRSVYSHTGFINTGSNTLTLQYPGELIENEASFEICVTALSNNLYACGNGYNSEQKKPEYVSISLFGSTQPLT